MKMGLPTEKKPVRGKGSFTLKKRSLVGKVFNRLRAGVEGLIIGLRYGGVAKKYH